MHEMGLALEILKACRQAAAGRDVGPLEEVLVDVGELSAVEPDLLRYAWEAAIAGQPEDGARLTVDWQPVKQTCGACGDIPERAPGSWLRQCPRCSALLAVSGGDALTVRSCRFAAPAATGT
jgi:hydrogenase nickel incorporation protein HypA/HybF